jgi:hypothetical protein
MNLFREKTIMIKRSLSILGAVAVFGLPLAVEAQNVVPRAGTTTAPRATVNNAQMVRTVTSGAVTGAPARVQNIAAINGLTPAQAKAVEAAMVQANVGTNFRFNQTIAQSAQAGLNADVAAAAYLDAVLANLDETVAGIANVQKVISDAFKLAIAFEVEAKQLEGSLGLSAAAIKQECGITAATEAASQAIYDLSPAEIASRTQLRKEVLELAALIDNKVQNLGIAVGGYTLTNARGLNAQITYVSEAINLIVNGQLRTEGAAEFFAGLKIVLEQQLAALDVLAGQSSFDSLTIDAVWTQTMSNVLSYLVQDRGMDFESAEALVNALGENCKCGLGAGSAAVCGPDA